MIESKVTLRVWGGIGDEHFLQTLAPHARAGVKNALERNVNGNGLCLVGGLKTQVQMG
jgi:hypothetical protein